MTLRDTTPEAERVYLAAQQRLSPGQRIERAFELTEILHLAALDVLQRQHPEWSAAVCRSELRRQQFGVS